MILRNLQPIDPFVVKWQWPLFQRDASLDPRALCQSSHLCGAGLYALVTNCHQTKPDHESQLRPLIGLTLEQAQLAWENAVLKAGGRKLTARLVKAAVKELQLAGNAPLVAKQPRPTKAHQRQLVDEAIGQLLMLASQKASYDVLTEKIEALHRQIRSLFPANPRGQT